jgi:hypothetical protein
VGASKRHGGQPEDSRNLRRMAVPATAAQATQCELPLQARAKPREAHESCRHVGKPWEVVAKRWLGTRGNRLSELGMREPLLGPRVGDSSLAG